MIVTKEIEFDYGHVLPAHMGFCNQVHGHRGKLVVAIEGAIRTDGSANGMVVDFKDIKKIMMEEVHEKIDHAFAVWSGDTAPILMMQNGKLTSTTMLEFICARNSRVLILLHPPTAETLAVWAYNRICEGLSRIDPGKTVRLAYVEWYETPTSYAHYNGMQ